MAKPLTDFEQYALSLAKHEGKPINRSFMIFQAQDEWIEDLAGKVGLDKSAIVRLLIDYASTQHPQEWVESTGDKPCPTCQALKKSG